MSLDYEAIADAIGYDDRHRRSVCEELRCWTRGDRESSTWACEVGGLRLRGGVSLPGYCTADFRGQLYAVRGASIARRAVLMSHLSKIAVPDLLDRGLRLRTRPISGEWTAVSRATGQAGYAVKRVGNYGALIDLQISTYVAAWYAPRALQLPLSDHADVWTCESHVAWAGAPHEIGVGPVAAFVEPESALVLCTMMPCWTAAEMAKHAARTVDLARYEGRARLAKCNIKRWVFETVRFEVVA